MAASADTGDRGTEREQVRELVRERLRERAEAGLVGRRSEASKDSDSESSTIETVLKTGGIVGLLALAAGQAGATPSGHYGKPGQPLTAAYTQAFKDTSDTTLIDFSGGTLGASAIMNLPTYSGSDPAGAAAGDMWYRSDLEQVSVETQSNGTVRVGLGAASDLDANTYQIIKMETASGVGWLPVADPANADHDFVRFQTQSHGVVSLHSLLGPLAATVTLNGGSMTATVYEDVTGDGSADNQQTVSFSAGNNNYNLSNLALSAGNDYWVRLEMTPADVTSAIRADVLSIQNGGVSWDTESDWDGGRDAAGVVSDGLGDHAGAGSIAAGYEYGSLTRGLVAYYPMDTGSGTTLVDGALSNDGTINGASWVAGHVGSNALSFNGTSDYVTIPDDPSNDLRTFTVSAWAQFPNTSDYAPVVQKDNTTSSRFDLWRASSSTIQTLIADGSTSSAIDSGITPVTDTWYHLVATYDDPDNRLYVNGVLRASQSFSGGIGLDVNQDITMAHRIRGGGSYGALVADDVRIYERALSASEVSALAARTSPLPVPTGALL